MNSAEPATAPDRLKSAAGGSRRWANRKKLMKSLNNINKTSEKIQDERQ
jgi:hypothetical protein